MIHKKKIFGFFTILLLFNFLMSSLRAAEIPVYYPTTLGVKDRQDAINGTGISAVVFARFTDFIQEVKHRSPNAVIAPSAFGKFEKNYKPALQFLENGNSEEKYLILALNDAWKQKSLQGARIGAIEEVDREDVRKLLFDLLKTNFNWVKSVAKAEDLISLLVFKSVDVIAISEEIYKKLKGLFPVKHYTIKSTPPVSRPLLYVKSGSDSKDTIQKIKMMPKNALALFGFSAVQEWDQPRARPVIASSQPVVKVVASPEPSAVNEELKTTVKAQKKILFVRKGLPLFNEVFEAMSKQLKQYAIVDFVMDKTTEYSEFAKKIEENSPDLLVLMDNQSVNFAQRYNKEQTDEKMKKSGVSLMALNLRKILKGDQHLAGVVFETPAYSIITRFGAFLKKKIKNVLVFYRKSEFQETIDSAREHLARVDINLKAVEIEDSGKSRGELTELLKTNLKTFAMDSDKYDAVWVMLDSVLLAKDLFVEAWMPVARDSRIPFVTGVEDLVQESLHFGTFAVTPDFQNLAGQASQIVEDLLEGRSMPQQVGVEELIAVNKIINLNRAQEHGLNVNESQLTDVKVIK